MPTVVQFRRGNTTQNDNFTGASGELSVDTTVNTVRVHDGATQGGFPLVNTTSSQTLSNKTYTGTSITVTGNVAGGNLTTAGVIVATGNVTGGNLNTAGRVVATGNVTGGNLTTTGTVTASGNITGSYLFGNGSQLTGIDATSIQNGTSNVVVVSSAGNIRFTVNGNRIFSVVADGITNDQANGVGNIGNSSFYFNTVFAKATSAQYADVAERYLADAEYAVGTVLIFGGKQEVTQSLVGHDTAIAGTVSHEPAYIMNTGLTGENVVTVALLGRVPVRVVGSIRRGDLLVSSDVPGVATGIDNARYAPGCVIGKALESYDSQQEGVIEAVVGRL